MKTLYVSPSCEHVLGRKPEEMIGRGPQEFVHEEELPIIFGAKQRKLEGGAAASVEVIRMRHKDGRLVGVEGNGRAVLDPGTGQLQTLVVTLRDIHQRKSQEDRLRREAATDGLTGLANRTAFDQFLHDEWARALCEATPLSLLLVDVDHFKAFNDRYGHHTGDDCLRAVARQLMEVVRRRALGARYGGDEMVPVLPDCDSLVTRQVAECINAAVAALRLPHAGNLAGNGWVSVSVGMATMCARPGDEAKQASALLMAADASLYRSKHEGRNRVASTLLAADLDKVGS